MTPHLPTDQEIISLCQRAQSSTERGLAKISDSLFVKFGIGLTAAEAATQKYAWEHANCDRFRVPEPYHYFQDDSLGPEMTIGYLVMEYVEDLLGHLSNVPVPVPQAPGPAGGGLPKGYVWGDHGIAATFPSLTRTECWLNLLLVEYQLGYEGGFFSFASTKMHLCHGDLAPRNIIRHPNGQFSILDWGFAGFYPQIFEIYAFVTRSNRESIFTQIIPRLEQWSDESQIQLQGKIERILLFYGSGIRRRDQIRSGMVMPKPVSPRPPACGPPIPGQFGQGVQTLDAYERKEVVIEGLKS